MHVFWGTFLAFVRSLAAHGHTPLVGGDGAALGAVVDVNLGGAGDHVPLLVEDGVAVSVLDLHGRATDDLGADSVLAVGSDGHGASDRSADVDEGLLGLGDARPVGQPLGLVAAEHVPLGTLGLFPAIAPGLLEQGHSVTQALLGVALVGEGLLQLGPLDAALLAHDQLFALGTEADHGHGPDGLLDLPAPLADQVIRAEHDGPVLAAIAALPSRALGVLMHRCDADQCFPGSHLPNDKPSFMQVEHLDRGGDHMLLAVEGVAEEVVEAGQLVAAGDVERVEGLDRLAAQRRPVALEVIVDRGDLGQGLDHLLLRFRGRADGDQGAISDGVVGRVAADQGEVVESGAHRLPFWLGSVSVLKAVYEGSAAAVEVAVVAVERHDWLGPLGEAEGSVTLGAVRERDVVPAHEDRGQNTEEVIPDALVDPDRITRTHALNELEPQVTVFRHVVNLLSAHAAASSASSASLWM